MNKVERVVPNALAGAQVIALGTRRSTSVDASEARARRGG
jgi:hypothetical protein